MLWEEIVIRFEWTFELERIFTDPSLSTEVIAALNEAGTKHKFDFNKQMVDAWREELVEDDFGDDKTNHLY